MGLNPRVNLSASVNQSFADFSTADLIALRQDETRNTIAKLIVGSILLIILFSFAAFWGTGEKRSPEDLLKLVQALVGPVIGVVGAVTGFYFGERSRNAPK